MTNEIYQLAEGTRLKLLREKLGMSQQIFATRLGVSIVSIGRWERGERSVTLKLDQILILIELLKTVGWNFEDIASSSKLLPTD